MPRGPRDPPIELLVLNLPRNRFFEVDGVRESLRRTASDAVECIVFDAPTELFGEELRGELAESRGMHSTTNLGKAYLFYEDAFWRSRFRRDVGTWPPDVGFAAVSTEGGMRLNVRWYDGPVVCDDGDQRLNGTTKASSSCTGLLEIYYSVRTRHSTAPSRRRRRNPSVRFGKRTDRTRSPYCGRLTRGCWIRSGLSSNRKGSTHLLSSLRRG